MLLPFFPLNPHLLGTASSCSPALTMPWPVLSLRCTVGVLFEELPRIAATEECAHRACLRMADVTVIHSVTTRATGFTATVMGRGLKLAVVSWRVDAALSSLPSLDMLAQTWYQGRVCDKRGMGAANVSLRYEVVGTSATIFVNYKRHASSRKWLPGEMIVTGSISMYVFNVSWTRRVVLVGSKKRLQHVSNVGGSFPMHGLRYAEVRQSGSRSSSKGQGVWTCTPNTCQTSAGHKVHFACFCRKHLWCFRISFILVQFKSPP
jgi:hypothetical protein